MENNKGRSKLRGASKLGVPQHKVSPLINYQLDGFSVERVMEFIVALGRDVEIIVRPTRGGDTGRVLVLEAG